MAKRKQLFLYTVLLSVYGSSSRGMNKKQEIIEQKAIGQECTFDMLPLELQEHIMSYVPIDNLYRALWSRCHNASESFYNDQVQTYVESHYVPKELIDKVIIKNFARFHGSEKQKREFKEKITRALERCGQSDTNLINRYRQRTMIDGSQYFDMPLGIQDRVWRLTQDQDRDLLIAHLMSFKEANMLTNFKNQLQKYNSYLAHCKAILSSETNKTIMRDMLCKLDYWLTREGYRMPGVLVAGGLQVLLYSAIIYYATTYIDHTANDQRTEPGKLAVGLADKIPLYLKNLGLALLVLGPTYYAGQKIVSYTRGKLTPRDYNVLLSIEEHLETKQKMINSVLSAIDQVERM